MEEAFGVWPGRFDLVYVADVEDACVAVDGEVLFLDVGVLDGYFLTGEGHELRVCGDVVVVEWCAFERFGGGYWVGILVRLVPAPILHYAGHWNAQGCCIAGGRRCCCGCLFVFVCACAGGHV